MDLNSFAKRTRVRPDGTEVSMEHIDTNILIRYIVKDDPKLFKKVVKLFSEPDKLFVFEDAAMMEIAYVLDKDYDFSRIHIAESIKNLMHLPNLVFNHTIIKSTLDIYVSHPKLSFVDCYQAVVAETSGAVPLWTFDRKLASQCKVAKAL